MPIQHLLRDAEPVGIVEKTEVSFNSLFPFKPRLEEGRAISDGKLILAKAPHHGVAKVELWRHSGCAAAHSAAAVSSVCSAIKSSSSSYSHSLRI